jgi:hypothetical protein
MMLIATAISIVLWMRDRKLFTQKLRELSAQQAETTYALNSFIDESGKITQHLTRLIGQNATAAPAAVAEPVKTKEPAKPRKKGVESRHMVSRLAQKGQSAKEIAERLLLPSGEVELMIHLNESAQKQVSAPA